MIDLERSSWSVNGFGYDIGNQLSHSVYNDDGLMICSDYANITSVYSIASFIAYDFYNNPLKEETCQYGSGCGTPNAGCGDATAERKEYFYDCWLG